MTRAYSSIEEILTEFCYRKRLESSHFEDVSLWEKNLERKIVPEDVRWMEYADHVNWRLW
jgi:hypothetical protein